MANNLHLFLEPRGLSLEERKQYIIHGGLTALSNRTLDWYIELLRNILTLVDKHGWYTEPQQGPGQSKLKYYAKKLGEIRYTAFSKRTLFLKTYAFLRDQHSRGFPDPNCYSSIYTLLPLAMEVTSSGAGQSAAQGNRSTSTSTTSTSSGSGRCGHCESAILHAKIRPKIRNGKAHCPFKDESKRVAKKAHALILARAEEHGWDTISTDLIQEFVDEAKSVLPP